MNQRYGSCYFMMLTMSLSVLFNVVGTSAMASETECLQNKRFNKTRSLKVECDQRFHFYNSSAHKKYYKNTSGHRSRKVRIGSFNLFHFGSKAATFKDLDLVAKIVNRMDVVAVTEIMPIMGRDLWHNKGIIKYLDSHPRSITARKAYIFPGYFKLLKKLLEQDKSWSLILSPTSQSHKNSSLSEYTGFYFRSSIVRPIEDEHCRTLTRKRKGNFACFPSLDKKYMGDDYANFFSRRPFLGHFESGNFDFSLLASHVVFNPPSDPVKKQLFLNKFFQVSSVRDVPFKGVTSTNFARLVEAKLIMKMMKRYKSLYKEQDVIYAGDMNINADNQYLLNDLGINGLDVLIDQPTTISQARFLKSGVKTNGFSEDYDHFLIDRAETEHECRDSGKTLNFFNGFIRQEVQKKYMIRSGSRVNVSEAYDYAISRTGTNKMNRILSDYRQVLLKQKTVKRNRLVLDEYKVEERVGILKDRLFMSQLKNGSFYRIYREVISDHMPIVVSCSTALGDDD